MRSCAQEVWEYVETFLIATSGEGVTGIYTMCGVTLKDRII